MLQTLMLFLASETAPAQATPISPPAVAQSAPGRSFRRSFDWRFAAGVVGNAIGFGMLMGACWLGLGVMHALLGPG